MERFSAVVPIAASLVVFLITACEGRAQIDDQVDQGQPPAVTEDDGGESRPDAGGTVNPDVGEADVGIPQPPPITNPNVLDQEMLFACETPTADSSPARIRRLTPPQFNVRFVPRAGGTPYGSGEQFRYSTDAADARIDDASAEQLLLYAHLLGRAAEERRISWGYCMRQSTLDAQGLDRPTDECLTEWGERYLERAWQREVTAEEVTRLVEYAGQSIDRYGVNKGLQVTAARPFLAPEFLFKDELAAGPLDSDGRARLGSWEVATAIAAAVTDMALVRFYYTIDVDEHLFDTLDALRLAAENDELQNRDQVEAHVRALLEVPLPIEGEPEFSFPVLPSNIKRFFQEYLGHPAAKYVFKNGGDLPREAPYIYYGAGSYPISVDDTIAHLYRDDQDFLRRLLTTRDFAIRINRDEYGWAYNLADGTDSTAENLSTAVYNMPADQRAGMLTHPGWLIAHSKNQFDEPHPVHRGKWIFENVLCGAIPDLPITVDAKLPDLPDTGVRRRLELATGPDVENGYCWGCHRMMDPLGIPFEVYDHYGRYRTEEKVADGTFVPVMPSTTLVATGDPALDGQNVSDAVALAELLADSERVEGCFVRNTFRYFMGRAETYEDACTLVQMRDAYRNNNGAFQEMLVTLLTSDAFLFRHPNDEVSP